MSPRVVASSHGGYLVEASNGSSSITMDLPKQDGGEGKSPSPEETVLAALGGCTAMTLRMYATRKGWPLEGVEVTLTYEKLAPGAPPEAKPAIATEIKLLGPLDAAQKAKLMEIAQKCPVYRMLLSDLVIPEALVG